MAAIHFDDEGSTAFAVAPNVCQPYLIVVICISHILAVLACLLELELLSHFQIGACLGPHKQQGSTQRLNIAGVGLQTSRD